MRGPRCCGRWPAESRAAHGARRCMESATTKFEVTPQGMFYTPNAHIGIALSLLFVGRVIYRMVVLYSMDPLAPQSCR